MPASSKKKTTTNKRSAKLTTKRGTSSVKQTKSTATKRARRHSKSASEVVINQTTEPQLLVPPQQHSIIVANSDAIPRADSSQTEETTHMQVEVTPEIHLFDDDTPESEVLLFDKTQTSIKPTTSSVTVAQTIAISHGTTAPSSRNVVNLSQSQSTIPPQSTTLSLERILEQPDIQWWSIIHDVVLGTGRYSFSQGQYGTFASVVANLAIPGFLIYSTRLAWIIFEPMVRVVLRAARYIIHALVDYSHSLKDMLALAWSNTMGGRMMNQDDFLYPEKKLLRTPAVLPQTSLVRDFQWQFSFSPVALKSLALFLAIGLAVVVPLKAMEMATSLSATKSRVLGASEVAYSSMQLALSNASSFSFDQAADQFSQSKHSLEYVNAELQQTAPRAKGVLQLIPAVRDRIVSAESLVSVGIALSDLGAVLSDLLGMLQSAQDSITLTQKIRQVQGSIEQIKRMQPEVEAELAEIDIAVVPDDMQAEVKLLQATIPQLFASLNHIDAILDFGYQFLGGDKQVSYLMMFQNSDEIRPTGGFLGTVSTIKLYQGKVVSMHTPGGGPYDWQAWLEEDVRAPRPLWLVNPVWKFQDANWFYDFPTTAKNTLYFYHQTEKQPIDGVLAINSYMLPQLLTIIGDIELPEYNKKLTPDNVLYELQSAVELEYDREENKPKAIIGDMFAQVMQRVQSLQHDDFVAVLELINQSLLTRDMQMYFTDQQMQATVTAWQWAGEVVQTNGDYLAIVDTNIGGGKTDKYMQKKAQLTSRVMPDGSIENTVVISRTNNGIAGDPFYGFNNVNYLRVYVPQGSQLIEAGGDFNPPLESYYEQPPLETKEHVLLGQVEKNSRVDETTGVRITEEFGKTVFGAWTQTAIGTTSKVWFTYRIPIKVATVDRSIPTGFVAWFNSLLKRFGFTESVTVNKLWHSMYWQRQSGQHNMEVEYTIMYPEQWSLEYQAREGMTNTGSVEYQFPFGQDFNTGFLFGQPEG